MQYCSVLQDALEINLATRICFFLVSLDVLKEDFTSLWNRCSSPHLVQPNRFVCFSADSGDHLHHSLLVLLGILAWLKADPSSTYIWCFSQHVTQPLPTGSGTILCNVSTGRPSPSVPSGMRWLFFNTLLHRWVALYGCPDTLITNR